MEQDLIIAFDYAHELYITNEDYSTLKPEPISYEIIFINSAYFYDPTIYPPEKFWWRDDLSFDIPQATGIENVELERKINENIANALLYWIGGSVGYLTEEEKRNISYSLLPYFDDSHLENAKHLIIHDVKIIFQSDRYLSIQQPFQIFHARRQPWYSMYINIDMQTGERVFLNDLIIVDEDFINLFWQGNIIQAIEDHWSMWDMEKEDINNFIQSRTHEKISKMLGEASYSPLRLGFNDKIEDRQRIYFSTSFYLEYDRLVLVDRWSDPNTPFILSLDDISEFLKVPRW